MSKYADIIKRLEEADGPDRALDAHILVSVNGVTMHKDSDPSEGIFAFWQDGVCHNCTRWDELTASIDAAVALVELMLPGWFWRCGRTSLFPNGWAFLAKHAPDHCDRGDEFAAADGKAQTPAIAILLSLFRALEAKDTGA